MEKIINDKIYEFRFIILPSGAQGFIYKIKGETNPKIYQPNNMHEQDIEKVIQEIKENKSFRGTNEKEWLEFYNKAIKNYRF